MSRNTKGDEIRPTSEPAAPLPSSTNRCAGILTKISPLFVLFRAFIALRPSASALPTSKSTWMSLMPHPHLRMTFNEAGPGIYGHDSTVIVLYALGPESCSSS